jgi:hypothetical protein
MDERDEALVGRAIGVARQARAAWNHALGVRAPSLGAALCRQRRRAGADLARPPATPVQSPGDAGSALPGQDLKVGV